jgi:hypothetical protein
VVVARSAPAWTFVQYASSQRMETTRLSCPADRNQ